MTWIEFTVRLAIAFFLGSAIGFERQWRQRMAGLRTNTLVCVGASLFVMFSVMTPGDSSPTRIAAQVVSGIGFLGGGVILREGVTVRGLNTAASLWCAAAIRCLSGAGLIPQAFIGAVAVLLANIALRPLGYRINQQLLKGTELEICYRVEVICRSKHEVRVRALLLQAINSSKMKLRSLHNEELEDMPGKVSVEADLVTQERNDSYLEELVSRLSLEQGVNGVKWRVIEEEYG